MDGDSEDARREAIVQKINAQEYSSARVLLLAAFKKFPRFKNFTAMLTAVEVLCGTEKSLSSSDIDWFKVLQVVPSYDDDSSIEKRYNNIVEQLQPVKDKVAGASLALEFARDAYQKLVDPVTRSALESKKQDAKKSEANLYTGVILDQCSTSLANMNGSSNVLEDLEPLNNWSSRSGCLLPDILVSDTVMPEGMVDMEINKQWNGHSSTFSKRTKSDLPFQSDAFEAERNGHLDKKQKMISSLEESSFIVTDCNPSDMGKSDCPSPNSAYADYYDFDNIRNISKFDTGQIWVINDGQGMPRRYVRITKIDKEKSQLLVHSFRSAPQSLSAQKWDAAGLNVVCGTFLPEESNIVMIGPSICSTQISDSFDGRLLEVYPSKGQVWAIYKDWDAQWSSQPEMRDRSSYLIVEVLTGYSDVSGVKVQLLARVENSRSVFRRLIKDGKEVMYQIDNLLTFSHKIPSYMFEGAEFHGAEEGMLELDPSAVPQNLTEVYTCTFGTPCSPTREANGVDNMKMSEIPSSSAGNMEIPCSGAPLYNFNKKPKNFQEEQIWAIFDDFDDMPRSYVKVISVVSPTEVRVAYLEPHPVQDKEFQWVEENLPVACGIFRVSRETTIIEMNRFSHLVKCEWSEKKSFYRIFPYKGEIWITFDSWNPEWTQSDILNCQTSVVEILSDFNDDNGVQVCRLTAVAGRLSFYTRQMQGKYHVKRWFPRLEILSFSHRVPAFVVTEIKNGEVPDGSWHLEPSAIPPKMFK